MWRYEQSTGELYHNEIKQAVGYSGHGEGLNNPAKENVREVGPIPTGLWLISQPVNHATKGPWCLRLTPQHHSARGRDGFLIHGDNKKLDKSASLGCIILPYAIRVQITKSKDADLLVVA